MLFSQDQKGGYEDHSMLLLYGLVPWLAWGQAALEHKSKHQLWWIHFC